LSCAKSGKLRGRKSELDEGPESYHNEKEAEDKVSTPSKSMKGKRRSVVGNLILYSREVGDKWGYVDVGDRGGGYGEVRRLKGPSERFNEGEKN